ncbi:hypothetical protein FKM82_017587 [Ascaphus truei]
MTTWKSFTSVMQKKPEQICRMYFVASSKKTSKLGIVAAAGEKVRAIQRTGTEMFSGAGRRYKGMTWTLVHCSASYYTTVDESHNP